MFTVETIARPSGTVSEDSGIPMLFVDPINDHWRKDSATILKIALPDSEGPQGVDQRAWIDVGQQLITDLLSIGENFGLCVDGDCPIEPVLSWMRSAAQTHELGVVKFDWVSSVHPMDTTRTTENISLIVVQEIGGSTWLPSLWADTESEWFHYGCDLMLTVYQKAPGLELEREPSNPEEFGLTLGQAVAWLVPRDFGFVIGLPLETDAYRRLGHDLV